MAETINDKYRRLKMATVDVKTEDTNKVSADQQGVVINHVTVRPAVRQSQDIQKWRLALMAAEQGNQQRSQLYDLYTEILLDGRLKQLINQRIARITNTPIAFHKDGKVDDAIKDLTRKKFFKKFLRWSLESRFWGHSLMELYWPAPGSSEVGVSNLIPRKHVKPKFGIVTQNAWDVTGLPYRQDPLNRFCIEVGDVDDLGLILECCPHVIFKRGGFGDWAEFAEVFGMPFRWATYNNEPSRQILEQALSQAGAAGYVVAPEDAKLEFFNPTAGSSSNDIFRFLIAACNEEMSVTILGNSMTTTEAKHSGYAQSETQMKTQDELHKDDREFVLSILNEDLTRYLAGLGYQVEGGVFAFEDGDGLSLNARLEIDIKVAGMVPIPEDYWYEKYMIPKPEPGEMVEDEEIEPEDPPNKKEPKPKTGKKS